MKSHAQRKTMPPTLRFADLEETSLLFEMLEEAFVIELDQATDDDAITRAEQNLRRVQRMVKRVQQVARSLKGRPRSDRPRPRLGAYGVVLGGKRRRHTLGMNQNRGKP